MSKILENKQLIHIAAEVVILVSLVYYFNQKHKKLLTIVEDLAQRIEDQEDLIQKHEQIIEKLWQTITTLSTQQPTQNSLPVYHSSPSQTPKSQELSKKGSRRTKSNTTPPVKRKPTPEQISTSPLPRRRVEELYDEEDDEDNSDLDAELVEELSDLHTDGLKK